MIYFKEITINQYNGKFVSSLLLYNSINKTIVRYVENRFAITEDEIRQVIGDKV